MHMTRRLSTTISRLVLIALIISAAPALAQDPTRFTADRPMDAIHIKLDLRVDLPARRVESTARLELVALRELSTVVLDAREFQVGSVAVGLSGDRRRQDAAVRVLESPATFRHDGERLEIDLERPVAPGDAVTVVVDYVVEDPSRGLHFFGPTEDEPDVPFIVWSQGESEFNSYWFPCFDNPNERQTTELYVTTDDAYQVSSNGRLVGVSNDGDMVTYHWIQDTPHVAYLVSMIVGEFHVERETWRGKPIEYWAHPRYADDIERSFRNTTRMLDYFSEAIGVEYPWDRYAQICCYGFGGGMENTAATTLGERALYDERSLLDRNPDGLIAHELAHQWWGDLLTCRDWAHLWLNEGFATYFETIWFEYDLGPQEAEYDMFNNAGRALRGGRERPIVDRNYPYSRAMFDSRAYPKGAWVLHMLRRRVGDEAFWRILNRYATDYAYQCVETVDLRKSAESVTGVSFERFFHDWTERPGHPEVSVSTKWHAEDGMVHVSARQTQEADAFHVPLTVEFRTAAGETVRVQRDMTGKELSFYQPLPAAPELVRVDPEYAVLMALDESKGRDLWEAQLRHDPSVMARIRAAEHFGESRVKADHDLLAEALLAEPFRGVQAQIAEALGGAGGDVARDGLLAGLAIDDARARRAVVEALDSFHGDEAVIEALRGIVVEGDASYAVEAAAIEALAAVGPDAARDVIVKALERDSRREVIRSAALSGLGRLGDAAVIEMLVEWSSPDRPRLARPAAISALARVTRECELDEADWNLVIATLTGLLDDTGRWVRGSAIGALREVAEPGRGRDALPKLRAIAANDGEYRLRSAAERTIEAIERNEPAEVQLDDIREELKTLVEENKALIERLEKLEGRIGAGDE